jgi:hypothetical protein
MDLQKTEVRGRCKDRSTKRQVQDMNEMYNAGEGVQDRSTIIDRKRALQKGEHKIERKRALQKGECKIGTREHCKRECKVRVRE